MPAVCRYSRSSSRQMAPIMVILAAKAHHYSATFPAMYFLLSLTKPIAARPYPDDSITLPILNILSLYRGIGILHHVLFIFHFK